MTPFDHIATLVNEICKTVVKLGQFNKEVISVASVHPAGHINKILCALMDMNEVHIVAQWNLGHIHVLFISL